jgi:NAD(P)-dependent dehydrogenase (short-subunit alcohol dehydrogenase family)
MSFVSTGVAVVTGAGSGIGRALAQQLAEAGSALALADIDEAGLLQTADSLLQKVRWSPRTSWTLPRRPPCGRSRRTSVTGMGALPC